jgi:organic radical activating enzyme
MTMCYHPWVGLDISPQGEFKPCCKYTRTIADNLDDYKNSNELKQLQEDFLAGRKPEACNRCWKDESAGLPSKRTLDNQYLFNNQQPEFKGIRVLGLTFGNTCNLACRICSSYPSSRWGAEAKKQDPVFMTRLIEELGDVTHIEIAGGEPFYADAKPHFHLLTDLIKQGKAGNVSLHYITNGTRLPSSAIVQDIWPNFKKVDVQVSIDGTKKQFEYNRWPASWLDLSINLSRWQEIKQQYTNIQLSISHTVSIFTLHALPDFLLWCESNRLPDPYLGLLSRPDYYSITALPESGKQAIERKFNLYSDPRLKPILSAMWAKDDSHLLDTTIKYVKILDKQRKQSFQETFPETYQLLGERCQTLYQLY